MRKYVFVTTAALLLTTILHAQKGLPETKPTSAQVNTTYPQHEDFSPVKMKSLKTADGYTVVAAATGLGKPRMLALNEQGELYVTRRDVGDVLKLTDNNNDGKFDSLVTVVSKFQGVHGITIHGGWIYLCSPKKLAKGKLNEDGSVGKLDTLINDLPDGGQHDNRTMAFGPDGKLYISIGSDCNDCKETNPEHATMIRVNADGNERQVFARGLRNTIGFDWHPETKALWGLDHGTDWRGDEIPPEELNEIKEGKHYGWPQVYGKQKVDYTREDPVGSTKEAFAKTTEQSVMEFPAHSAPLDFRFLSATKALVTWHGSWNRKNPEGFKVQFISFKDGRPTGTTDFLHGFLSADKKSRFGRPTGLAISKDKKIFISDDAAGVIYCVMPSGK